MVMMMTNITIQHNFLSHDISICNTFSRTTFLSRVRSLPGVRSRHQNIDTVIIRLLSNSFWSLCKLSILVPSTSADHHMCEIIFIESKWYRREQTEGEYSAIEHESVKGVVESLKVVTREKSHRLTCYVKSNFNKHSKGWLVASHC